MPEENDLNMLDIKYTSEDIDRIYAERVVLNATTAALKAGVICEWVFKYPNGQKTAQVEHAFCINPKNNDFTIGLRVCNEKIKNKLWEICGQYSLITGKKL